MPSKNLVFKILSFNFRKTMQKMFWGAFDLRNVANFCFEKVTVKNKNLFGADTVGMSSLSISFFVCVERAKNYPLC